MTQSADTLLQVSDLTLHYRTRRGTARAVDGVSFDLRRNEALVVLGESGSGKSSLAKALMRLLPRNIERFSGQVMLGDTDVMQLGMKPSANRSNGTAWPW